MFLDRIHVTPTLILTGYFLTNAIATAGDTIVKWGDVPADTEIVTANARGLNQFGATYDEAAIGSPEDGTNGYTLGVAGQTRTFYGAMSSANTVPIIHNNGSGDRIQMVHNLGGSPGTLTSMIAWQASDFLASGRSLESMTVSYASRGGDGTTISFLIETSSGWYQSDQTDLNDAGTYADFSGTNSSLTWSPFSEFGVTGGVGAADTADIKSVGLFTSSTNTSSNFIGCVVSYFEVAALPDSPGSGNIEISYLGYDVAGNLIIDFIGTPDTTHGVEFSPDFGSPFAAITGLTTTTDRFGDGTIIVSTEEMTTPKGFFRIVSTP